MSQLIEIAMKEMGVKEIVGKTHNNRILTYAKDIGMGWINDDETPWCSIFVNWVCKEAGVEMSSKPNARSWVKVGTTTKDPSPGDVVIFWRESPTSWKGHVGFFLGFSSDLSHVFCLGGNQGNAVGINAYASDKVLRFQRVTEKKIEKKIPKGILKRGSRGTEVFQLQILLNHLGYNCGDPDGIFGGKTENALKFFQADQRIAVDGTYSKADITAFDERMNSTA